MILAGLGAAALMVLWFFLNLAERLEWEDTCRRLNAERLAMGLWPEYVDYPKLPQTGLFINEWR